jgi:transcription elongation factor GreA
MEKIPITKDGYERLKKELENLKTSAVPKNIRDIEEARAHGDISENAEYAAAKERQAYLHGRIQELENNLATSNVIDLKGITGEKVVFGATVCIRDINSDDGIEYKLVGPLESDIGCNKISVTSPIGRALIGKCRGDEVRVKTPGGARAFEIVDIYVEEQE